MILWYLSSLAIEHKIQPTYYEDISRFITVLLGVFLAFWFNSILANKRVEQEKSKASKELTLEKIEVLFSKIHSYSRSAKKYLWSIKLESGGVVIDHKFAYEAQELLYECEVFKKLYFEGLPLDPDVQYAELERLAGECNKHWSGVKHGVIQDKLDACKAVGKEVEKLENLLKPIKDWCLEITNLNK